MLDICLNGDSEMLENVGDLDAQYEVEDTVMRHLNIFAAVYHIMASAYFYCLPIISYSTDVHYSICNIII